MQCGFISLGRQVLMNLFSFVLQETCATDAIHLEVWTRSIKCTVCNMMQLWNNTCFFPSEKYILVLHWEIFTQMSLFGSKKMVFFYHALQSSCHLLIYKYSLWRLSNCYRIIFCRYIWLDQLFFHDKLSSWTLDKKILFMLHSLVPYMSFLCL